MTRFKNKPPAAEANSNPKPLTSSRMETAGETLVAGSTLHARIPARPIRNMPEATIPITVVKT